MDILRGYKMTGAYVEITSSCNLKCKHCYNESGTQRNYKLDIKTIEKIIEYLKKNNILNPSFAISGGEPFTHNQIWDILKLLNDNNIKPVIVTNGTLLSKETAQKLETFNYTLQVSLNGSTAELHNKICGDGSYDMTIVGLKNLGDCNSLDNVSIHTVLNLYNLHDVVSIVGLLSRIGIKNVSFSTLNDVGRAVEYKDKIGVSELEVEKLVSVWNESNIVKDFVNNGGTIKFPEISLGCPLLEKAENEESILINPRIDYKGDVYICQSMNGKKYSIGNLYKDGLKEIFNGDKLINIVNYLKLSRNYISECVDCVWKLNCPKGCPAVSINSYNHADETDGYCSIRKMMFYNNLKAYTQKAQE